MKTKNRLKNILWFAVPILVLSGVGIYREIDYRPPEALDSPPAEALYRQSSLPIEVRVTDLISRMTIEEKVGQMAVVDKNSLKKPEDVAIYALGGVLSGAGAKPIVNTPEGWLDMVDTIKQDALQTRLGIVILFGVDAIHGHANVPGATVFPHAIGLGASANPELVGAVAEATTKELIATGVNWNFAPVLDAPEDFRWGRAYESFSSDPNLNGRLGSAYINGAQGLGGSSGVIASAKHFMGIGSMKWGESNNENFRIDQGRIDKDDTRLDEYMAPFKDAVDTGVGSIMLGLTEYGDSRIIDNKYLITEKLKNEMGFKGIVVSDWFGLYEYAGTLRYNANVRTINAGIDMAMLPFDYKIFVKDVTRAVSKGDISEERINDATSRILAQKFKSGLFDRVIVPNVQNVGTAEHRELARLAVASSAVLLKNDGNVLPLSKNTNHIRIAGSGADNIGRQAGGWTVEWQGIDGNSLPGATSILEGIKQVTGDTQNIEYDIRGYFADTGTRADVGIVLVSEKPYAEGFGDNEYPMLEPEDKDAIRRVKQSAEKVVIIVVSGRPLMMNQEMASVDAVVAAWLPGSEGAGIADVIFGDKPFVAKLPIDWPARMSQVPIRTNGQTADGTVPLFKRGYGLQP